MHCSLHKINGENCWWMSKAKEVGNLSLSLLCINLSQFDCSANVNFFFYFMCYVVGWVGKLHGYRKEGSIFFKKWALLIYFTKCGNIYYYTDIEESHKLLCPLEQSLPLVQGTSPRGNGHSSDTTRTAKNNEELIGMD